MAKMLQFHEEALNSILKGVKQLAKISSLTLGPKGRNVIIQKDFSSLVSTKDGVTVSKEVFLKNKFENMGVQLVKEAAAKTGEIAGEGTTTAIILAEAIFSEGIKNIVSGANPMQIKKGIEKAVLCIQEKLDEMSKKVKTKEEIKQIAIISSNNDEEIGEMISNAMEKVGQDGIVTLAEAKGIDTTLDVVEGMQFDKGYNSPYFITNPEKMCVELKNVILFITDKKLSKANEIVPLLEKVMEKGPRPFLIIAEEIEGEALATLVINKIKGGLNLCAVNAPAFGDRRKAVLEDIATIAGATVFTEDKGMQLKEISEEVFGFAKRIKIAKETTTIIEGKGEKKKIQSRIKQIKEEISRTTSDVEKKQLEERLAKLIGGVAVIHVGAPTEVAMKEKKMRIEDAIHATKAAAKGGVVPGGGVAFLRAEKALDALELDGDENLGKKIISKSLFIPIKIIANNCGKEGSVAARKVYEKENAWGYNGLTDQYTDLIEDGVIDPVLVPKYALVHAASIASLLLTISVMVTEKDKPKEGPSPMPPFDPMME